ncbi:MAG: type IV pilus secretin PilQ, partial [Pseudomonadota bacterium]
MRISMNTLWGAVVFGWFAAAALLPSGASAQAAAAGNSIERIDATQTGTSVVLTIQLKAPAPGVPPSFSVANPARIAIDLPQTINNLGKNLVE